MHKLLIIVAALRDWAAAGESDGGHNREISFEKYIVATIFMCEKR
jgi:hypothetical protein